MQLKTVIFDLDDTIYTDWDTCHAAGLRAVGAYGAVQLGVSAQETERAFSAGRVRAIEQLGPIGSCHNRVLFAQFGLELLGKNPVLHAENMHRAYWDALFDTMVLEPAVPQFLDDLRAAGVRTAICTNMMADIQMRKLNVLGVADKIDCFVTSEEAGADKPLPEIFRYVLQKIGSTAQESIMVGDSYAHDVCGAAAAGMDAVWISRKGAAKPEGGAVPKLCARSMDEAAAFLRDLAAQGMEAAR